MTPLYPQKLALTSPTGGGRSVGIVRSRTKATEFFFFFADIGNSTIHFSWPKFQKLLLEHLTKNETKMDHWRIMTHTYDKLAITDNIQRLIFREKFR